MENKININELKVACFDIIAAQDGLRAQLNKLEEMKQEKLKELTELLQEQQAKNPPQPELADSSER